MLLVNSTVRAAYVDRGHDCATLRTDRQTLTLGIIPMQNYVITITWSPTTNCRFQILEEKATKSTAVLLESHTWTAGVSMALQRCLPHFVLFYLVQQFLFSGANDFRGGTIWWTPDPDSIEKVPEDVHMVPFWPLFDRLQLRANLLVFRHYFTSLSCCLVNNTFECIKQCAVPLRINLGCWAGCQISTWYRRIGVSGLVKFTGAESMRFINTPRVNDRAMENRAS